MVRGPVGADPMVGQDRRMARVSAAGGVARRVRRAIGKLVVAVEGRRVHHEAIGRFAVTASGAAGVTGVSVNPVPKTSRNRATAPTNRCNRNSSSSR